MAQANLPTLPAVLTATPGHPASTARNATTAGSDDQAFARVLDKQLKTRPEASDRAATAASNAGDGKASSAAARAEASQAHPALRGRNADDLDDAAAQLALPAIPTVPAEPALIDPAALATDATGTANPSADPLQASLAGLPAALAAQGGQLPAEGAENAGQPEDLVAGQRPALPEPAASALAGSKNLGADVQTQTAAATHAQLPAAALDGQSQASEGHTFGAVLERAAGVAPDKPVLSAVETEAGPASRASDVAQLAANPGAGDAAAARAEPNPGAGLPWGGVPAPRPHADDSAVQMHVPQPTGHPAWAESVGSRVTWMVGAGESKAELVLTPPQLGRVEVTLTMNGEHTTAQFVAATPAAREALEQAMPRLREVLADAGISLTGSGVSTSDQQGSSGDAPRQGSGRPAVSMAPGNDAAPPARPWLQRGQGLVDTFA